MALKESIKQFGRFIGVLQPQQPYYDPYGYPPDDGGYYGGQQYGGGGHGQHDGYAYGAPQGNPGYGSGRPPQGNPGYGGGAPMQPSYGGQGGQRGYYDEEEYPPQPAPPPPQTGAAPYGQQPYTVFGNSQRSKHPPNNVVQMPRHEDGGAPRANKHSEIIVCVRSLDDCQEIINALLEAKSVFINMEPADDMLAQRVIDILGGASFALRGTMTKISHRAYLVAPNTVDVINSQPPVAGPAFRGEFSAHRR
ncbi:MAG: cell division protein SepF [Clostridia bacterium]|nr:cell division protein SepF [Clostridia bacterium]